VTHAAEGVGYLNLSMGFLPYQDPQLVDKSGVGVKMFVDFNLHVFLITLLEIRKYLHMLYFL
jgi:hypothetical protein